MHPTLTSGQKSLSLNCFLENSRYSRSNGCALLFKKHNGLVRDNQETTVHVSLNCVCYLWIVDACFGAQFHAPLLWTNLNLRLCDKLAIFMSLLTGRTLPDKRLSDIFEQSPLTSLVGILCPGGTDWLSLPAFIELYAVKRFWSFRMNFEVLLAPHRLPK